MRWTRKRNRVRQRKSRKKKKRKIKRKVSLQWYWVGGNSSGVNILHKERNLNKNYCVAEHPHKRGDE